MQAETAEPYRIRLVVQRTKGSFEARWLETDGQESESFPLSLPLDNRAKDDLRWYLEKYVGFVGAGDRVLAAELEQKIEDWGRRGVAAGTVGSAGGGGGDPRGIAASGELGGQSLAWPDPHRLFDRPGLQAGVRTSAYRLCRELSHLRGASESRRCRLAIATTGRRADGSASCSLADATGSPDLNPRRMP